MKPVNHLLCGAVLAAGNYLLNREKDTSAACFLGAFLCDTDHLIEYADYCREFNCRPDFEEWYSGKYFDKKGTVKVIFHSWELCFLSWILYFLVFYHVKNRCRFFEHIFRGLTIGYTSHLVLDHIGNNVKGRTYFLLYRWKHRWKQRDLDKS